jgi:hypothetical protein
MVAGVAHRDQRDQEKEAEPEKEPSSNPMKDTDIPQLKHSDSPLRFF